MINSVIHRTKFVTCCDFEYGFDDASEGFSFDSYRDKWINEGFKFSSEEDKPDDWNKDYMAKQLENIKKVDFKPRNFD